MENDKNYIKEEEEEGQDYEEEQSYEEEEYNTYEEKKEKLTKSIRRNQKASNLFSRIRTWTVMGGALIPPLLVGFIYEKPSKPIEVKTLETTKTYRNNINEFLSELESFDSNNKFSSWLEKELKETDATIKDLKEKSVVEDYQNHMGEYKNKGGHLVLYGIVGGLSAFGLSFPAERYARRRSRKKQQELDYLEQNPEE